MISQKNLDYSLPAKELAIVKEEIFNYDKHLAKSQKVIDYDSYPLYPSLSYGSRTYTATPSRRTENLALDIAAESGRIRDAKHKVKAIKNGIARAANTAGDIKKRNGLKTDLEDNLLKKYANQGMKGKINREPRTLRKYKERAYYFIAVELGLITIDKDIALSENQLNRKYGAFDE